MTVAFEERPRLRLLRRFDPNVDLELKNVKRLGRHVFFFSFVGSFPFLFFFFIAPRVRSFNVRELSAVR